MNDPRFRGAGPASGRPSRRDAERGLEEGLETLRLAIRDLMARPKPERAAHLAALKARLLLFVPQVETVDKNGPAARRIRAMERVLAALEEASEKT